MRKKYLVELTKEEREYLHKLISAGTAPARKLNRARILLKADVGKHAEAEALIDRQRDIVESCGSRIREERGVPSLQAIERKRPTRQRRREGDTDAEDTSERGGPRGVHARPR